MRSPFSSEQDAFRFLLTVIAAVVVIVLAAALGPTWLALAVLALIILILAVRFTQLRMRRTIEIPLKSAPPHAGGASERRVLVVANDTLGDQGLVSGISMLASAPGTRVLILVPAVVAPGDRVTGAVDVPLSDARTRLAAALDRVADDLDVKGEVSAEDPIKSDRGLIRNLRRRRGGRLHQTGADAQRPGASARRPGPRAFRGARAAPGV